MSFLNGLNEINAGLLTGLGGVAGGIAGSQGTQSQQNQSFQTNPQLSQQGQGAQIMSGVALQNYGDLVNSQAPFLQNGPAQYAQMLQQYTQSGGLPNQQQIGYANQYAQNIFAPQQAQLNNVFQQAQINTDRQAASLGRPVNDPILQAKLAQYQGQQQSVLSGQQTALASQVGMQLPQQQLGYAQALNNSAFQNQQNVLGLGGKFLQGEQMYALGAAGRFQNANGVSGGGLGGGLAGLFSGLSGGANLANAFGLFNKAGGAGGTLSDAGGALGGAGGAGATGVSALGDYAVAGEGAAMLA